MQLRFLSARLRPFFFQLTGTELEAGGLLLDKKPGQLPGAKLLVTSVHSGDKWQILWWQWTRECSYTFWFPPKGVPCATLGRVSYYFCFPSEKNTFCWEIKYLGYRISLVSWRGGCFEDPFACSPRTSRNTCGCMTPAAVFQKVLLWCHFLCCKSTRNVS